MYHKNFFLSLFLVSLSLTSCLKSKNTNAQQREGPYGSRVGGDAIVFDDGTNHLVRSVSVGLDADGIVSLKVVYERNGNLETKLHGEVPQRSMELGPLNAKNQIKTVNGTYLPGTTVKDSLGYISSLKIETTGTHLTTTSFGAPTGKKGEVPFHMTGRGGNLLVGFHGRVGKGRVVAIGAIFEKP